MNARTHDAEFTDQEIYAAYTGTPLLILFLVAVAIAGFNALNKPAIPDPHNPHVAAIVQP